MYLTDIVFIEEGNPKQIPGTNLINYHKCRLVANAVRKIMTYQQMGYAFKKVPEICVCLPPASI